jgi:hypothetical protein
MKLFRPHKSEIELGFCSENALFASTGSVRQVKYGEWYPCPPEEEGTAWMWQDETEDTLCKYPILRPARWYERILWRWLG